MNRWIAVLVMAVLFYGCGSKSGDSAQNPSEQSISMVPNGMANSGTDRKKALIRQGAEYLNHKDVAKAVATLNQAAQENPNDPEPQLILGDVYMHLNNFDGAVKSFETAVKLQPDNGQAFYLLGICYGLNGDRATAQKALERSALIFQQKHDEPNFQRSVVTLQQMMQSSAQEGVSSTLPSKKMK